MNSTTAVLNEDMILEIVMRLPLKCAIRCMVLNKNICCLVSERKKALVSPAYPDIERSIFYRCNSIIKIITPGSSKISDAVTRRYDPGHLKLLDSCNGVLLLKFKNDYRNEDRFCVFNPITGETMPIRPHINLRPNKVTVALAVDLDEKTTFQFKLVVAEILFSFGAGKEPLWRFTVFVPSGGTSWLEKSPVELKGGRPCNCDQFVYVHGCMYYYDELSQSIVVFDVEKEKARNIDGPQEDIKYNTSLLGSSDGSLQCVYVLQDEIKIHSYDQVKEVWELKHKVTHTVFCPIVLFCNGHRLLIVDKSYFSLEEKPSDVLFHMYDILSDEWEKINPDEDFSFKIYDPETYFSFVPTLAKVSDIYLHDPEFEFAEVFLRGLQRRLVMQETEMRK